MNFLLSFREYIIYRSFFFFFFHFQSFETNSFKFKIANPLFRKIPIWLFTSQIGNKKRNTFQYHLHLCSQIIPWFQSTLSFFFHSSLQTLGLLKNSPSLQNISISSSKNSLPFHKNPIDETLKIYKISCNHLFVLWK